MNKRISAKKGIKIKTIFLIGLANPLSIELLELYNDQSGKKTKDTRLMKRCSISTKKNYHILISYNKKKLDSKIKKCLINRPLNKKKI